MIRLLKESSSSSPRITLPMQLVTVDSLLEMTSIRHAQYGLVADTVKSWLRSQELRECFHPLKNEINLRFKLTL